MDHLAVVREKRDVIGSRFGPQDAAVRPPRSYIFSDWRPRWCRIPVPSTRVKNRLLAFALALSRSAFSRIYSRIGSPGRNSRCAPAASPPPSLPDAQSPSARQHQPVIAAKDPDDLVRVTGEQTISRTHTRLSRCRRVFRLAWRLPKHPVEAGGANTRYRPINALRSWFRLRPSWGNGAQQKLLRHGSAYFLASWKLFPWAQLNYVARCSPFSAFSFFRSWR